MKSLGKVALVGLSGVVFFKVGTALVFPMFGMLLFLLGLTLKVAAIVAIGYFVYNMLNKRTDGVEVHDIHEEIEIEMDP